MAYAGLDPSILQDFLTESGELLERLEGDLVALERDPCDPEMLNQVFRALHTIKGSASFLALTNLVAIAHAAESALNAARNSVIVVDRAVMDLLLQAVDLIKRQMGEIRSGEELSAAAPGLIEKLADIGNGKAPGGSKPSESTSAARGAPANVSESSDSDPLVLSGSKGDLLEFLVADLDDSLGKIAICLTAMKKPADRPVVVGELGDLCEALNRAVEFFEFAPVTELARALSAGTGCLARTSEEAIAQVLPRCEALVELLRRQSGAMKERRVLRLSTQTLLGRLCAAADGQELPADAILPADADARTTLIFDAVDKLCAAAAAVSPPIESSRTSGPGASPSPPAPAALASEDKHPDAKKAAVADQTIRVEVGRLESLMNLVGELVLQKNRIAAISRGIASGSADNQAAREAMTTAAGGLDRVTADIQVAVMRTRMQPLEKLFGRYPRLIRDLAGKTGKKMELVIQGGDTEVDKSVIEEMGDPLVHLLRNAADHGIEDPATRAAAGKCEMGTLSLIASHEGSHVRILVKDDGKGLVRERIAAKAVERGLVTPDALSALSDRQVFEFIFLPGFSTAEKLSDLSGRGVGLDVVRTNVQKLKGAIELSSVPGKGTTIAISIPLTVAILPAMMVSASKEVYAVPLTNILEIVRPQADQVSSIGGRRVMRLRDTVLPLVSASEVLEQSGNIPEEEQFAVVLSQGDDRVGLMVSGLIGQQEIVVKPLDVGGERKKAVSGATVRDDGGVSLIVDVEQLFRLAEGGGKVS